MAAGDPGSPARYYSSTAVETSLQSSIAAQSQGASNTSFIVASISGFPTSYPYTLIVDPDTSKEEVVTVTSGSSTTLTVTRGADNTQAVAHSAGAVVRHGVSAREFRESENHIAARGYDIDQAILDAANQTHVHGIATGDGVIVGTTKAQTLTNKVYSSGTVTGAFTATSATFTGGTFTSATVTSSTVTSSTIVSSTLTGSFTASGATFVSPTISGSPVITGLSSAGMTSTSATPKSYVDAILGSATAAATSAASAAASATAAATSATSAAASASAASGSASAASASATAAATSATSAANSATAAATSATSAANSATAAATSATSAAASATAAASSATTAAASVAAIAGYAAAAATSEANALTSANSAATSAASAAASTNAAAVSASSAAASATAAATSATSAANSATAAATSATNAAAYELSANNWATLMTGPVAGGEYSAKYNAGLAATSATSAATSATSAANSATAAATSAASAATSASSAAASFDQFDDRYLGAKSTPPTLDNDGNPLATGAIYFYTVDNNMYAWNGTTWVVFTSASAISTVVASTPLTGGGSGGTVTVGIQDASTSQKGAVQLTDSVSSTSTTSAATPNSVKQAYDLAASALAGLHFHDPVETATSSNISLSGLTAINGYTPIVGDRILVKNQSTQANNGIYVAASGSWSRATDFDTWDEVYTSATYVKGGNLSGESFITTVASTGTVGVTAITWALFATDAVYSAGTGLTLTGTTFAIDSTVATLTGSQTLTNKTLTGPVVNLVTNAQASNYTLVLSDASDLIEMSGGGTLTVPTNASVAFPIGTQIHILQTGVSQVTVGGAGVTINATPGLKLRTQWSGATLVKRATDTWVLVGDLSA